MGSSESLEMMNFNINININIIMIVLTVIALVGGVVFGLIRGRNRSLLRLGLIVVCIIGAFFLRGVLVDVIMGIETPSGTVEEMISSIFEQGETEMLGTVKILVFAIIEMNIVIISYYIMFSTLRFLTEIILFPILKHFVKVGKTKGRLLGAVFGLVQGILIAIAVLAPMNGVFLTVNSIAQFQMNEEKPVVMINDIGLDEYVNSPLSKFYTAVGGWYFDAMTNIKLENGSNLNMGDTSDMVTTATGIAGSVEELGQSMDILANEDAKPEDKIGAIKNAGDKLIEIGEKIDSLSDGATTVINGLMEDIKELIDVGEEGSVINEFLGEVKIEDLNFKAVGQGLNGLASYIEKTALDSEDVLEVTQEDVDNIVNGFAGSPAILDLIPELTGGETPQLLEVSEDEKEMFKQAIDNLDAETITEEQKQILKDLFGIKD